MHVLAVRHWIEKWMPPCTPSSSGEPMGSSLHTGGSRGGAECMDIAAYYHFISMKLIYLMIVEPLNV